MPSILLLFAYVCLWCASSVGAVLVNWNFDSAAAPYKYYASTCVTTGLLLNSNVSAALSTIADTSSSALVLSSAPTVSLGLVSTMAPQQVSICFQIKTSNCLVGSSTILKFGSGLSFILSGTLLVCTMTARVTSGATGSTVQNILANYIVASLSNVCFTYNGSIATLRINGASQSVVINSSLFRTDDSVSLSPTPLPSQFDDLRISDTIPVDLDWYMSAPLKTLDVQCSSNVQAHSNGSANIVGQITSGGSSTAVTHWSTLQAQCADISLSDPYRNQLDLKITNSGMFTFQFEATSPDMLMSCCQIVVTSVPVTPYVTSKPVSANTSIILNPDQTLELSLGIAGIPTPVTYWQLYLLNNVTMVRSWITVASGSSFSLSDSILSNRHHFSGVNEWSEYSIRAASSNKLNGTSLRVISSNSAGTYQEQYLIIIPEIQSFNSTASSNSTTTPTGSSANAPFDTTSTSDAGSSSGYSSSSLYSIVGGVVGGGALVILIVICICCVLFVLLATLFALLCVVFVAVAIACASVPAVAAIGSGAGIFAMFRKGQIAKRSWNDMQREIAERNNLTLEEIRDRVRQTNSFREIRLEELTFGKEIGSGAYGSVYVGKWQEAKVAIKVLSIKGIISESAAEEFRREATLMAKVGHHPNIIHFVGACMDAENMCIVTHFCNRGSLLNVLNKEGLNWKQKMTMARDAAAGIAFLHSQGIIHRDLAARNVLVGENYDVYIADFGYSRIFSSKEEESQSTKSNIGPIRWMAPEAMVKKVYSKETDCFSFSVLLWEIATDGQVPYPRHENLLNLSRLIVQRDLRPEISPHWPYHYCLLMQNMWELEPSSRPSMKEAYRLLSDMVKSFENIPEEEGIDMSNETASTAYMSTSDAYEDNFLGANDRRSSAASGEPEILGDYVSMDKWKEAITP